MKHPPRKLPKIAHDEAQFHMAARDARRQFGLEIDRTTIDLVIERIKAGAAWCAGRGTGVSYYDVTFGHMAFTTTVPVCRVVFDHSTQMITCFTRARVGNKRGKARNTSFVSTARRRQMAARGDDHTAAWAEARGSVTMP